MMMVVIPVAVFSSTVYLKKLIICNWSWMRLTPYVPLTDEGVCIASSSHVFAINSLPWAPTGCSSTVFLKLPLFYIEPHKIENIPLLSGGLFSFLIKFLTLFLAFAFSFVTLAKHANRPSELQPPGSWGVHVWSCTQKFLAITFFTS